MRVGTFSNPQAALRLVGVILLEQQDEWLVEGWYFNMKSMERGTQFPPLDGT